MFSKQAVKIEPHFHSLFYLHSPVLISLSLQQILRNHIPPYGAKIINPKILVMNTSQPPNTQLPQPPTPAPSALPPALPSRLPTRSPFG